MAKVRRKKSQPRTIEREALHALRAQLRIWAAGHEIPGTPAHKCGPSRDQNIPRIADILLGTGTRPGEALALRRCDIDITTTPWRATICGTIVRVDTKLFRQPWTKTAAGYRTVHLPGFAVRALEELGADDWKADDETLVFPNRKGNPRELQNFGRIWRQARGTTFAWVTPATFRKVVATIIAEEVDADQAGRQLGHVPGSNVTELHYIDRPSLAPDSSPILDRLVG